MTTALAYVPVTLLISKLLTHDATVIPIGAKPVGRPIRQELSKADRELKIYIKGQLAEFKRLGFPPMATFAKNIARGDVGMPPPTGPEEPIQEAVGAFFYSLMPIERKVLSDKYAQTGTEAQRARWASQSIRHNRVTIDRLLLRLSGWLSARGF
jgi:hypothetical protein